MSDARLEIFVGVSTGHFDPLIEVCERLSPEYRFFGQIGMGQVTPSFTFVRTLPLQSLKETMARADLVVTHAGTGMLSLCYELRKKVVVVPKQKRYGESNDGQVELGRRWCEIGLGTFCLDLADLKAAIETARHAEVVRANFPSLGKTMKELVG
jgi:UDP-N-acetylglucosamine transferase subunit ALG13